MSKPLGHKFTVLKQLLDLIPAYLVSTLAREYGVDKVSRKITPWSHVVALLYTQLSHALSLNDVCDALRYHGSALATLRGAVPPSRNGLSHANRSRNAGMAEALFWKVLDYLRSIRPGFGTARAYCAFPRRFKRIINAKSFRVADSTTIKLVADCLDWAKHRRRKAAAKCHMLLDLQTFLPRFAVVKSAASSDPKVAPQLCAGLRSGEIVVFDKAYVDFAHLWELHERGIFWVTRAKNNMSSRVLKQLPNGGRILKDSLVRLTVVKTRGQYHDRPLRKIDAVVTVDGKDVEMTFLTNNTEWAAASICDIYKSRWGIEVFFKELKQTLQLADFLGHNENAVRWQVWTALLAYILLRFLAHLSGWQGSFSRLFTTVRGVLWSRYDLDKLLTFCGTAPDPPPMRASPEQLYLPGFMRYAMGQQMV